MRIRTMMMMIAAAFFGMLSAAWAATEPTGDLVRPEHRLEVDRLELGWADLFGRMAAVGAIRAEFTEERFFRFRIEPKRYEGEFRKSAEGSVSLAYTEVDADADALAVHVGPDFAFYRKADGSVSRIPAASSQRDMLALFPWLVSMQVNKLAEVYDFYGKFDGGGAWRLVLVERADASTDYGRIYLAGHGPQVSEIVLQRSPRQKVRIEMRAVEYPEAFDAEERARFFFQP